MTTNRPDAEREARALCDELHWMACSSQSVSDERLDAYAAAIRTERDTAWQAAIEGMRRNMNDEIIAAIDDPRHSRDERSGLRMARIIADRHCAALSALADRMGVTNE